MILGELNQKWRIFQGNAISIKILFDTKSTIHNLIIEIKI